MKRFLDDGVNGRNQRLNRIVQQMRKTDGNQNWEHRSSGVLYGCGRRFELHLIYCSLCLQCLRNGEYRYLHCRFCPRKTLLYDGKSLAGFHEGPVPLTRNPVPKTAMCKRAYILKVLYCLSKSNYDKAGFRPSKLMPPGPFIAMAMSAPKMAMFFINMINCV